MQCVLTGRDSLALMGCAHHAPRAKNRTMNAVGALTASTAPGLSALMGFNAAGVQLGNSPMSVVHSVTRVTLGVILPKAFRVMFATWELNPILLASVLPRVFHALAASALETAKVATGAQPEVNPTLWQLAVNFAPSESIPRKEFVWRVNQATRRI